MEWERKNEEFRLNGNFYDVIKIEENGNEKIAYCVSDKDEDALLRAYENYLHKHQKEKSQKLKKPGYFFQEIAEFSFENRIQINHSFFYESENTLCAYEVISPPPELIS